MPLSLRGKTLLQLTISPKVLPTIPISATDRMIVKIYLNNQDSTTHSVIWYTEGNTNYSYVTTSVGAIAGTSGTSGSSGQSGSSGSSGTSGTGFDTISNYANNRILTSDGGVNTANAEQYLNFDGSTLTVSTSPLDTPWLDNRLTKKTGVSLTNFSTAVTVFTTAKSTVNLLSIDYWVRTQSSPYKGRGGSVIIAYDSSSDDVRMGETQTGYFSADTSSSIIFTVAKDSTNLYLKVSLENFDHIDDDPAYTETYDLVLSVKKIGII